MTEKSFRNLGMRVLLPLLLATVILLPWVQRRFFPKTPSLYRAEAVVMGDVLKARLILVPDDEMSVTPQEAAEQAFAAIREVDRLLNPIHPESDARRLQELASRSNGKTISVHPLTWQAIMESLRFHRLSNGAFDITVGPLLSLYTFRNGPVDSFPLPDAIQEARKAVGSRYLRLEREGMRVGFARPGMKITFGGIAQGFALDRGKEVLQSLGVRNAILEVGGEMWILGKVPHEESPSSPSAAGSPSAVERESTRPWHIGIRHPRQEKILKTLEYDGDCAISTSGDYEKFFEVEGKRYSHILDPRTGLPTQSGVISATVVSPRSCVEADALATALSVLGPQEGEKLLRYFPGVDAYLVLEEEGEMRLIEIRIPRHGIPPRP